MITRIRPLTRYRVIMWTSLALMHFFFICIILGVCLPYVFKDKQVLLIVLFAFFTIAFTIIFVLAGHAIASEKRFLKQLTIENTYTLGEPTQFYNLDAFKLRVDKLSRKRGYANRTKYVVAFTPTGLDVSSNRGRDAILRSLNYRLTKYLDNLMDLSNKNPFDVRHIVYGFSRGIFFFCLFTNDDTVVNKLIGEISNECFRMVNEDKIKIWVQPFYGIKKMEKDENIVSATEDALIARDISEKNYESYTYFKESFRFDDSGGSNRIKKALENNEFVPFYQPKYSLKEHRFISCEALARWNSPEYGLVGPSKFIELAEKAGLLNAIDIRIFELAVKDLSEGLKRGRTVLPVSVNFSLYEFFSRNFFDTIMDTLKKYDVPPHYLEIEITETTSQANKFLSLSVIKRLKQFGIRVLMDDFGVGYSQIDNIRQIPFDAMKIDKSFTDRMLIDVKTASIIKYLVELAHTNDMEAIIEGVETKEQVEALKKLKIDTVQGFYYSKPLPISEYTELLRKQFEMKGDKR